jgi:protein ImuB
VKQPVLDTTSRYDTHLWLHVHFPCFPLDVVARALAPDAASKGPVRTRPPVIVIEGDGARAQVVALEPQAIALGLRCGMRLKSAWALAAGLTVCQRDLGAEARMLEEVATWLMQFSSIVVIEAPYGIGVEIGGSVRLFGGLPVLIGKLSAGIAELGFAACIGIAPTPAGARLLAKNGSDTPALTLSALEHALSVLPLDVLASEVPAAALSSLRKLGLSTLGECVELPRVALNRRIERVVKFLDCALGHAPDPQRPFVPPTYYHSALALPVAVNDVEALLFGLKRLLLSLVGYLRMRSVGVLTLVLTLSYDPPASSQEVIVSLLAPSREVEHLMMLVRESLERTPLQGEVSAIAVAVPEVVEMGASSQDLFDLNQGAAPGQGFAALVERLCARLGADALHGLALQADHRPERAWSKAPVSNGGANGVSGGVTHELSLDDSKKMVSKLPQPSSASVVTTLPERPAWLLPNPKRLEVVSGLPVSGGTLEFITGPERIESGWWDGADISRDYYRSCNPRGEALWVFEDRRDPGSWYLHGVFA